MIHYFLDGDLDYSYWDSWQKHAGHMEFVRWERKNLPVNQYPELAKFIDQKKWSVLSDFVRRWAILNFGGIYLDWDVELIKPIDDLLSVESFVCIEGQPVFANTAVTGGKLGNNYHRIMLDRYMAAITGRVHIDVQLETYLGTRIPTKLIEELKGSPLDNSDLTDRKKYGGFETLPKDYFFPFNWNEKYKEDCITENTRGIHWWKKGW